MKDPTTPWSALLVNESYEAGDELESEDAKQEILRLLWDAVYPELPPLRDSDIYRLYEAGEGNEAHIALERLRDGKEVARIVRFKRVDERVVVEYELLDTGLMPATLRKLLRAEVPRFLAGSSLLEGVRSIECVDIQLGRGAVLPLQ